ncbi:MAG: aspartate ammonia-lyase, aspartate ammonia-lyase, partial [Candidatus Peregrinibacteria bacterium GW2011_GWE2_39_6]
AAHEFINGKFDAEFQIDIFQAGAGTPYNMNANEIIANRANEILKAPKGSYQFIHPNNHVNMSQSSNDVIPTAIRLATLMALKTLKIEAKKTILALKKKGTQFKTIIKVGRTHLEDAVPISLGQEFMAYASAITTTLKTLEESEKDLLTLGIGGTAIGTGINTHPLFQKTIVSKLTNLTHFKFKPASNLIETTHSMASLLKASSALRAMAVEINRIANDLRLLNMGPKAGIAEITLPEAEPGSSIMPGKVNPSIAECMNMICFQVIANDQAVSLGAQGGQLELNWFTPLIMWNLLFSIQILTNGLSMFHQDCIDGIKANSSQINHLFEHSLVTATALAPYLGYHQVALLVKEALKAKKPLREIIQSKNLFPPAKLTAILSPDKMIHPTLLPPKYTPSLL